MKQEHGNTAAETIATPATSASNDHANRYASIIFFSVLVLAFGARLGWWLAFVDVIENEGVEYARLAENLIAGDGYVGIYGGRNVMFPPLFPVLIGFFSIFTGDAELAGRVLGLLSGTALVGVLYAIARHVFDTRAAIVVGVLAAVHPLLVALSVSLYSEGVWLLLIIGALYAVIRSFTAPAKSRLIIAGLATGLAYLVRPEGIAFVAYLALALIAVGLFQRRAPAEIAKRTSIFLIASMLVALPNMVYLSSLAGSFRWEGKSTFNNLQNERINAGLTVPQATRGLDSNGNPVGLSLTLHQDQAETLRQKTEGDSLVKTLLTDTVSRAKSIVLRLLTLGIAAAPWIYLPIFAGILLAPWWRVRLWEGLVLLGVFPLQGVFLLTVYQGWERYYFPLLPLLVLWCGAGLAWFATSFASRLLDGRVVAQLSVRYAISIVGILALALGAYGSVRAVGELEQAADRVGKEIGQSIAADVQTRTIKGRPLVMGLMLNAAYYSKATMRYLPYANEEATLTFIHSSQPHYIVVRDFETNLIPYANEWLQRGIPDTCAELIKHDWSVSGDRSRVWRWNCDTSKSNAQISASLPTSP